MSSLDKRSPTVFYPQDGELHQRVLWELLHSLEPEGSDAFDMQVHAAWTASAHELVRALSHLAGIYQFEADPALAHPSALSLVTEMANTMSSCDRFVSYAQYVKYVSEAKALAALLDYFLGEDG